MKRIAVIVIGSNSTRLLAADANPELTNELRGRVETRLFLGMTEEGNLSSDAIKYTAESVASLKRQAEASGAELLGVYATSASRDAKNSQDLSASIEAATGHPLTILSGDEEACYSFFGAAGHEKCGIIDIGGGSTEIVLGCGMDIAAAHSLQLGAARLFKMQPINSKEDVSPALRMAKETIRTLPDILLEHHNTNAFYLIGGTGTSTARILGQAPEGCLLTRDAVEALLIKIAETPRDERVSIPGFPPSRIDILPTGMAILLAIMDELCLEQVKVTTRVNADGLLRSYVHKKFA